MRSVTTGAAFVKEVTPSVSPSSNVLSPQQGGGRCKSPIHAKRPTRQHRAGGGAREFRRHSVTDSDADRPPRWICISATSLIRPSVPNARSGLGCTSMTVRLRDTRGPATEIHTRHHPRGARQATAAATKRSAIAAARRECGPPHVRNARDVVASLPSAQSIEPLQDRAPGGDMAGERFLPSNS